MKPSEHLIKAKAIIVDPKNWTQEVLARNANSTPVDPGDSNAVCFCSMGALVFVRPIHYGDAGGYLNTAMGGGFGSLGRFNDSHTHNEVMEAWDKAIAAAIADGN